MFTVYMFDDRLGINFPMFDMMRFTYLKEMAFPDPCSRQSPFLLLFELHLHLCGNGKCSDVFVLQCWARVTRWPM